MPLSPSQTRELLRRLDHSPNIRLGQNFLIDGNIVRKSIELSGAKNDDIVVEIGPGLGTLTRAILETNAKVWAVERDPHLAAHLESELVSGETKFRLTQGDCLEMPLAGLPEELAKGAFKIVANLPYAVTTPWMEAVLNGPLPQCMVLMLQKEAADRYVATEGNKSFGAISIFLQSAFSVHSQHKVSANCFHPAPKVDSTLIRFDLKATPIVFSQNVRTCIRRIFTQRRKQLGALCRKDPFPDAAIWFEKEIEQGMPPNVRPEAVSVAAWQRLARLS